MHVYTYYIYIHIRTHTHIHDSMHAGIHASAHVCSYACKMVHKASRWCGRLNTRRSSTRPKGMLLATAGSRLDAETPCPWAVNVPLARAGAAKLASDGLRTSGSAQHKTNRPLWVARYWVETQGAECPQHLATELVCGSDAPFTLFLNREVSGLVSFAPRPTLSLC